MPNLGGIRFSEWVASLAAADVDPTDSLVVFEGGASKKTTISDIESGGGVAAEDVVVTPAGGIVATDVQAALEELDTEIAAVGSPDATDVAFTPAGNIAATDVQAAIEELDDEKLSLVAGGASVENIGAVESNVNTVAATGSTETLDLSTYAVHDVTMDESCAFTLSNPAPSGKLTVAILIIRGAFTPSFTNTMIEPDGAALTYSTPSVWLVWTVNGGTSYFLAAVGKAFA